MIKLAKIGWHMLDVCFLLLTGITIMDATITLAAYSLAELFTIDKIGSLIVSIVVVFFWVLRYRLTKRLALKKSEKEQEKLDLEIQIRRRYLERKDMEGEYEKLINNDKWFE